VCLFSQTRYHGFDIDQARSVSPRYLNLPNPKSESTQSLSQRQNRSARKQYPIGNGPLIVACLCGLRNPDSSNIIHSHRAHSGSPTRRDRTLDQRISNLSFGPRHLGEFGSTETSAQSQRTAQTGRGRRNKLQVIPSRRR
jgi:hypothetical protein